MDLRPQLERLDGLLLRSLGLEPDGLAFAFRPLWQLDAAERAAVALTKAQTAPDDATRTLSGGVGAALENL